MGRRSRGMYQNGRRDGRGRMDGMHFDIIPFALTPSPRKVTPPRKVPPPRKLFSNCPVPCGPAPPSNSFASYHGPPWMPRGPPRTLHGEGELLHQSLNTFKYMPGQTGRAACRPPGRPAIRPRGPGPPSAGPIGQAQTPENRLEIYALFIHFQFARWGRRS